MKTYNNFNELISEIDTMVRDACILVENNRITIDHYYATKRADEIKGVFERIREVFPTATKKRSKYHTIEIPFSMISNLQKLELNLHGKNIIL